jgi:hypothetical protein
MNPIQMQSLQATSETLFQTSSHIFWAALAPMLLLAILALFFSGDITGSQFEKLFKRLIIAILLLIAFPTIASTFQELEHSLIEAFGGESGIAQVFAQIGTRAQEIKQAGTVNWLKIGQIGLSIISTLSFLILAIVKRFLDVLHLAIWNLLLVLGPLAFLACLFPSFSSIPKGIFTGMLELSLWKPVWVILGRVLIAIGFTETPEDPSQWFNTAVMNFAVAGLMASTPMLVHGFLSGTLASIGGSTIQTMISGAGTALTKTPMAAIQSGVSWGRSKATHFVRKRPHMNKSSVRT